MGRDCWLSASAVASPPNWQSGEAKWVTTQRIVICWSETRGL